MIAYQNIDTSIAAMARRMIPRLSNGLGIDVERVLREHYDVDIARIPGLVLGNSAVQGCCFPDRSLILIEANDPPPRQRFTLAHELGHLELHYGKADVVSIARASDENSYFRCTTKETPGSLSTDAAASQYRHKERQADVFATRLLMPRPLVQMAWEQTEYDLGRCAGLLAVSKQALEYRLNELGLASGF